MPKTQDDDIAAALGVLGAIMAVGMALMVEPGTDDFFWFGWVGLVPVAGISAWAAGRVCGGLFGRSGVVGWVVAAGGACLSTICVAIVGGTFVYPVIGTLFAPLVVLAALSTIPTLTVTWLGAMIGIHLYALKTKGFSGRKS